MFRIQVFLDDQWKYIKPAGPNAQPYEYSTLQEAEHMLRICYPQAEINALKTRVIPNSLTPSEVEMVPLHRRFNQFSSKDQVGDKTTVVPVLVPLDLVYLIGDQTVCAWDFQGRCWMFGYHNDKLVRYHNPVLDNRE